jgi:hypothetical protein
LQGNVPNDRIKRTVHSLHVLIRDLDPKLVLDLIQQLGEIKIRIDIAGIVLRSNALPAIAELLNVDPPNPDRDILGDTATAVAFLIEGLIFQLRSFEQLSFKA